MKINSFPPIAGKKATLLILGSMPGATSLHYRQYYAHPQNAFWRIMASLSGADPELPYEKRLRALKEKGIALWDVIQHCVREGSLDADIRPATEHPNAFDRFLPSHPGISDIVFNGRKAEKSFRKHVWPDLPAEIQQRLTLATLPSTSPANARMPLRMKQSVWQTYIRPRLIA
jgi:hypoxanthine-DNA glycosylase